MKRSEFEGLLASLQMEELAISQTKGREYAQGDEDALLNFKRAAQFAGVSPLQVCLIYMYKHFAAVASYAEEGDSQSDESIRERLADLRLYAALFLGLAMEDVHADL